MQLPYPRRALTPSQHQASHCYVSSVLQALNRRLPAQTQMRTTNRDLLVVTVADRTPLRTGTPRGRTPDGWTFWRDGRRRGDRGPMAWLVILDILLLFRDSLPLTATQTFRFKKKSAYWRFTIVTIWYATLELPVSSVLFNKKHFNPICGHFLKGFQCIWRCSTPPNRWAQLKVHWGKSYKMAADPIKMLFIKQYGRNGQF